MPTQPPSFSFESSFVPAAPVHPEGGAFYAQVSQMLNGQEKGNHFVETALTGWDEVLEKVAADLYRIGSMLLGEGEGAISLIEQAVATAEIPSCNDHLEARHSARRALAAGAIERIEAREPGSLAAPNLESGPSSCIEDDDLSAAGLTHTELEQMLAGPDRARLRDWLEGLSTSLRVVFVLRGVAGLSSTEVAALLAQHGGHAAQEWTPDAVRSIFRQALCSLASQLLHASTAG